jgi:hypothetical protein
MQESSSRLMPAPLREVCHRQSENLTTFARGPRLRILPKQGIRRRPPHEVESRRALVPDVIGSSSDAYDMSHMNSRRESDERKAAR